MMERKSVICVSGNRKIKIPGVEKVIIAIKNPDVKPVQASVNINLENIRKIRQNIKEE